MRVHQTAARLRTLLGKEGDFAAVLRGAGLVVIIRVLASAVGFASMILLTRWMGSSVTARVLTTSAILAVVFGLASTWMWGNVGTAVAFSAAMVLGNALLTIFVVRKLEIYPSLPVEL